MPHSHDIDETIHQKTRLVIMSHLAAVGESDFLTMKKLLGLTDGNISVHTSILESRGLIESEKSFVGKKTKTTYKITSAGRKAFEAYVVALESVLSPQKQRN
jgi:DNA-binding MarR family transcriptional regulator